MSDAFVVIDGTYCVVGNPACRGCGSLGYIRCTPGEYPQCQHCNARLLYLGRVPSAPCVTGSGRIDGHMTYVKPHADGSWTCSFCGAKEEFDGKQQ